MMVIVIAVPLAFLGTANWRYARRERKLARRTKPKIDL